MKMENVSLLNPVNTADETALRSIEAPGRWTAPLALGSFTILYFAMSLRLASRTPLSVDEVFVTWMVRYFPAGHIIEGLKLGLDTAPPAYYWLVGGMARLLGRTPLAIRLPSIFGFYAFSVAVFLLLRRRLAFPIAVFAMYFTCATGAAYCAVEARPYALVVGCFGVAAAAWAGLAQSRHRAARLLTTTAALCLALSMHFLALYIVVALGLGELVRTLIDRKIQWSYWLVLLAGSGTLLLWLPVIAPIYRLTHASIKAPGFYAKPDIARLVAASFDLLSGTDKQRGIVLVALLLIPWLLVWKRSSFITWAEWQRTDVPPAARDLDILAFAAFTLPLITFVFSVAVTGSFNPRYFLACVLGLILVVARGLQALPGGRLLTYLLLLLSLRPFVSALRAPVHPEDPRVDFIRRTPEQLPVVLPSGSDFYSLSELLPPDLSRRIAFVGLPPGAVSPDPEPELIARNWKRAVPSLPIYTAEEWSKKSQRYYVLYTADPREGLTDWLLVNAKPQFVRHQGNLWLLRIDTVPPMMR